MADVVEKKLDMSLDQIASERKQETTQRSRSVVSNSSSGGGSYRPRDDSASPRSDHFGGKARSTRRADRIAHSAPYKQRVPRYNSEYHGNDGRERPDDFATSCRVYVGNLSWSVTWQMLKDYMRQAGDVLNVNVLEVNGRSRGCAIVTYRQPYSAQKAIETLHSTELDGRSITVREDRVLAPVRQGTSCRVYVGNLSWNVKWQDLKDHMKRAGTVVHADVLEEASGRSKGCGLVEYSTPVEARNSIDLMTNTELDGRLIFVREDREPEGGSISMIKSRLMGRVGGGGDVAGGRAPYMPSNHNSHHHHQQQHHQMQQQQQQYYPPPPPMPHHHQHHHQYAPPLLPLHHQFAQHPGPQCRQIYIGNLPFDTHWQSLQDLFRTVGQVERTEIPQYPDGRSRGFGIVRFTNPQDAWQAIELYDQAEVNGRVIEVRLDRRNM